MMKIPTLDLKAQHQAIEQEILDALARVVRSQRFILGEEVTALEERIAAYCQTAFAVGVSSGTDALLIALMALGIGAGDEVITTPYTFFATAGSIARTGAKPVFVDIDPVSYNLDPRQIEKAVTSRTKAILPVHLFGQCADMAPILEIAQRFNLPVIEDAAQAIGAEYPEERRAGSMGIAGCFSFFPSKNLGGMGDGGMVVTQDKAFADQLRRLRVHGSSTRYYHQEIGGNFRLDEIQAAVLNVKLQHLSVWIRQRQEASERYERLFGKSGLLNRSLISLPAKMYHHTYNQYVVRVSKRDALKEALKQKGVETAVYYPVPLHLQECFKFLGHQPGHLPEAERASHETLALPIYPQITEEQQRAIVTAVQEFYGA